MPTYIAHIHVLPQDALLDPQGKAVGTALHNLGFAQIEDVRVGKHIRLKINADNRAAAETAAEEACTKLLTNPIMEQFSYVVHEANEA
jgi:phosphoribosylformylglycinamidine synthase